MTGFIGKQTNSPKTIYAAQSRAEVETKTGELFGEIISFNASNQTAEIKPLYKPKVNGVAISMPNLLDVPVRFPRAGGGALTFPVAEGDKVVLRPQMKNTESYHAGGEYEANDARYSSLSDMEAFIDGGEPLTNPIEDFDSENVHLRPDNAGSFGLKMSKQGKVSLNSSGGEVLALIAEALELLSNDGLNITGGSSAGTNHALQNKDEYANLATKIRDIIL